LVSQARTQVYIVFFKFYKVSFSTVLDIIDWDILKQHIRWIRPTALMNGSVPTFDLAIRPHSGLKRLLDVGFVFDDSLNINFNKDLSKTLIDILNLGWNGIRYPENISEDDTKEAFEVADFVPQYPDNFYYGDRVGLVPENMEYQPIRNLIRYLKQNATWAFEVLPWFNWWIFQTRTD
jgi:hypothetical protein